MIYSSNMNIIQLDIPSIIAFLAASIELDCDGTDFWYTYTVEIVGFEY